MAALNINQGERLPQDKSEMASTEVVSLSFVVPAINLSDIRDALCGRFVFFSDFPPT